MLVVGVPGLRETFTLCDQGVLQYYATLFVSERERDQVKGLGGEKNGSDLLLRFFIGKLIHPPQLRLALLAHHVSHHMTTCQHHL